MASLSLLIKPASGNCNLKCDYCFYMDEMAIRQVSDYGFMTIETLENLIQKAFQYASQQITFAFQGGEPTLRGLEFFETFINLVEKYNKKNIIVSYALQTNGTLLDDSWARFLQTHRFLVGLSIDGPRDIHDTYRRDIHGIGSHDKVMKITSLLKLYKVDFNILCVVNNRVVNQPEKVYRFFKKHDFDYLQFIPCLDGIGSNMEESYALDAKSYGKFLVRLFDLWEKDIYDRKFTSIRYFDNLLQIMAGFMPESCELHGVCTPSYVVEANGGIYPCDFYVVDKWALGNINESTFDQLSSHGCLVQFVETSKIIQEPCKKCDYFALCRGGCKRQRETDIEGVYRTHRLCHAYKFFFKERLERMMAIYQYVIKNPFISKG